MGRIMRGFLLLTSLMALVLGFAGTALGVRPRPKPVEAPPDAEALRSVERRLEVVIQALEDLEERFEEHVARTPAVPGKHGTPRTAQAPKSGETPQASMPEPPQNAEVQNSGRPPQAAEPEPPQNAEVQNSGRPPQAAEPEPPKPAPEGPAKAAVLLLTAALEQAESRLAAGDAGGARKLFQRIVDTPGAPAEHRLQARMGIADSWTLIGAKVEARAVLEALERELADLGKEAPAGLRDAVRRRLDAGSGDR
jgi:hypothetical protein